MKKWLYFLLDDQGRSYKSTNGNVTKTAQPTPLPNSPDGWQDISLGWERNLNRFGIIRTFSLPLGFIKAANHILRTVTLTGTVESKLFLLIKKFTVETTVSTYRFIYRFFYKGELDLTTAELDEEKSTVSIMEGGLVKDLAANEATVYEFDLETDAEAISVVTDGFVRNNTYNYIIPASEIISGDKDFYIPVFLSSKDSFTGVEIGENASFYDEIDNIDELKTSSYFFFRAPADFEFDISGSVKFRNNEASPFVFGFRILDDEGNAYFTEPDTLRAPGVEIEVPFNFTINTPGIPFAPKEYRFFIIGDDGASGITAPSFTIFETTITLNFLYRFRPTITKCFTPDVLYRKLIGKITGKESDAISEFLDSNKNLVLTSGDMLRQISGSKIKTSLKDFFDSYNTWLNAGMSIESKKIRLEQKSRYFNSTDTPFHLGKAKELKIGFAADLMFSSLRAGYAVQETETVWGKFEFNNTSFFTGPIKSLVKDFSLISPYRADPTGIELARINLEGKTTTDDNSDNDVFVLNCDIANPNLDGSFNLKRVTYDTMLGIPDESQSSIFNIEQLTPKRIIRQHGNWLRSILYGFEAQRIKFQTTQKNRDLRTVLGSELIDEDLDELIGNLAAPLFKPYYFEFNCESPIGITEQLDINPNIPFSFEWDGVTYTGFLIKAGITPDNNKEQTFKLLSTPLNDITQLI